ncbi:type II toxin-antitoxin system RelE/ParE family toxin [Treponema lecithinolyticum]|uniref:type II toxin-antitoxin system RelE family toxin n=1 Tax=Treponema lecithinolyticum TaxID=53418 RepID=UPI0036DB2304
MEKKAEDDFAKLDKTVQRQIFKYLKKIEERQDPRSLGAPLQDNLSTFWKYRVGDYRLIAQLRDDKLIVFMLVVAHRREVYKIAKKRLANT